MSLVEFELKDHIAVITFNRPEKLNAMSPEMMEEFHDTFHRFIEDDDAWVGVRPVPAAVSARGGT